MRGECETVDTSCCACCGIAEIDDIKLMECDGCDLVRYCGDECKREHETQHEEDCKKRAAELREELLFKQPENSHRGDCPICSLPLPLDLSKSTMYECCSKFICKGCLLANSIREGEQGLVNTCPFCRVSMFETEDERRRMKRIEANDPEAICQEGAVQYDKGDFDRAFEFYAKSAELGNAEAHLQLSVMYRDGEGVGKDEGKYVHHLEEAAIGGHPDARFLLGCVEWRVGKKERAVKHWIIAATLGEDDSIKMLMKAFKLELVDKDVLAATLRAHKAAVDATKSPQRKQFDELFGRGER